MYIITKNNPCYPTVEYRENLTEATQLLNEWVAENDVKDGRYKCEVTLAEVLFTVPIKTDY